MTRNILSLNLRRIALSGDSNCNMFTISKNIFLNLVKFLPLLSNVEGSIGHLTKWKINETCFKFPKESTNYTKAYLRFPLGLYVEQEGPLPLACILFSK